ncbi:MAG: hypothetical protein GC181_13220 [Bacteroidetes bacterium]|nr:hypothetical protein [Bacteroidota bacterium]
MNRRNINRNRYRNFLIGIIGSCTFTLWAFNVERVPSENSIYIIEEPDDDGVQIYAFTLPPPPPKQIIKRLTEEKPFEEGDKIKIVEQVVEIPLQISTPIDLFKSQDLFSRTLPDPEPVKPSPLEINPDVLAAYPGGQVALTKYLERNVKYPEICLETNRSGKVVVKFIVDEFGYISQPVILKDELGCSASREAIKALNGMPKWTPATKNGRPVKSYFIQTFSFNYK